MSLYPFALVSLLITVVIAPSVLPVHSIVYEPAVTPDQFAQYKLLYYNCQPVGSPLCLLDTTGLEDLDWGALRVVAVDGTSVTLSQIAVYKNGTATQDGALVDVDTGMSNVTSFATGTPTNYFVLAGNLQAGDRVWNTNDAPTLNETVSRPVLGAQREVNLLNFTSSYDIFGSRFSYTAGIAFDAVSGVFVDIAVSLSGTGSFGNSQIKFAIVMVDNNIWLGSSLPDFSLDANPTTVSVNQGSPGTSTVTIVRTDGFSPTVALTATSSPDGLSCSLFPASLSASGSDTSTLSCSGSPGTYTVTVIGNGGYTSHEKSIIFNVAPSANPTPAQSASQQIPVLYIGAGIAAVVIIILSALLLLMRKPEETQTS